MLLMLQKFLPSLCTLGNLIFGILSLALTFQGHFTWATACIVSGMLLDGCDGRLARRFHVCSSFGKELDSLADLVTFGVAPGLLAYVTSLHQLGPWGMVAMLSFPVMGALRLARFNMQASNPGFFTGFPITLAGGLLALFLLNAPNNPTLVLLVLLWLSWLMISPCRYPDFKNLVISWVHVLLGVVFLAGAIIVLHWDAATLLMVPLVIYLLTGIKNWIFDLWQAHKEARAFK